MSDNLKQLTGLRLWITLASIAIVIMVMRAAAPVLVPILLSIIFSIIFAPLVFWLEREGLAPVLAVGLVILLVLVIGLVLIAILGKSVADLTNALPTYETRLAEMKAALQATLDERLGLDAAGRSLLDLIDPQAIIQLVAEFLTEVAALLGVSFFMLILVIFTLLEASSFPIKLRAAFSGHGKLGRRIQEIIQGVQDFIVIKVWLGLITGVAVTIWLVILGIEFPVLLGLVAFLLYFIPEIGSVLAAIPAILLGLLQYGVGGALLVALGYVVIFAAITYLVAPRFLSEELDLSIVVIFISLLFWGWVFGSVAGLILALPMTVAVKITLEGSDETRWLAILLGSGQTAKAALPDPPNESPVEPSGSEEQT